MELQSEVDICLEQTKPKNSQNHAQSNGSFCSTLSTTLFSCPAGWRSKLNSASSAQRPFEVEIPEQSIEVTADVMIRRKIHPETCERPHLEPYSSLIAIVNILLWKLYT
ncbi:uncharacterized protein A4U43_C07F32780 [Asparagus officinalis]|uniref:Uncharacterized protein n=1 Tax=Asparagus officinalis TaxID=4686 RepID=A0A5P1EGP3_ASPOF|nr:uncharacterized protein A4U43_C07F32780 [Asparagus officinalis]